MDSSRVDILLVDDKPENLLALESMLTRPEYNLVKASSGPQALSHILKQDFAVILLDIFMPEMDGYEVATMIKARAKSRHIPIIFLTAGVSDIQNIYRAYQSGAVDYIQKPIDADIVRAKVEVFADLYLKNIQIRNQAEMIRRSVIRQKELELASLRQASERKFKDLVEGIEQGFVWTADPVTMNLTYLSPQASDLIGYPIEYWFSDSGLLSRHLHDEEREFVISKCVDAKETHDTTFEHRFRKSDGSDLWLRTGIRLAKKIESDEHEIRGISIDVTTLKNTEEALKAAVQIRDEFLSIASHELKTPLTPMKLQVQLLSHVLNKNKVSGAKQVDIGDTVLTLNRQIERLNNLVDNLLDISRIRAGRLSLNRSEITLGDLVGEVVEKYCEGSTSALCKVVPSVDGSITGSWDRLRLEQVLVNLVTNALRYGDGKPFEISYGVQGDHAFVTVRDQGIGIRPEDQKRIFDRFERASPASSFGGLGLGLYIADQIVRAHGGLIRVQSEILKGSAFTIDLPLVEAEKNPSFETDLADHTNTTEIHIN